MGHDASKVQLGATESSFKNVENRPGVIEAGKIVRLKSDNTISIAAADGAPLGISLGASLSGNDRTAVVKNGDKVPIQLTAAFTPTIGAQVCIDDVTGIAKASGSGVTAMNATYISGILTGIKEDGVTTVNVALIDMQGGL